MSLPALAKLVPHTPPMLLLDQVLSYEPPTVTCGLHLKEGALFVRNGQVSSAVGLEYMAQAIAAYVGMERRLAGLPPLHGYLVGARAFQVNVPHINVGNELQVSATLTWNDSHSGAFACRIERGAELVASAHLTVYQPDLPLGHTAQGAP